MTEVFAAKVAADLDTKIQEPGTTGERFVRLVYAELKATRYARNLSAGMAVSWA